MNSSDGRSRVCEFSTFIISIFHMGNRGSASHGPPSSALSNNLSFHIQFKLGHRPGFPRSGPGGIAHLLNSPKNTLPFRTPPPQGLSGGGRSTLRRWLSRLEGFSEEMPARPPPDPSSSSPSGPHRGEQHRPQLCSALWSGEIYGSQASAVRPQGRVVLLWSLAPSLPPSFCLMAPRRPLSQCPY